MLTLDPSCETYRRPTTERILVGQDSWLSSPHPLMIGQATTDVCVSRMSALRQGTNPLTREGLAAQSSDYVCRSNYLNERK